MDVRHPYRELDASRQGLPETLEAHSGLVVLGGEMHAGADADHPWLTPTKELIRLAVQTRVPTLGVCLGHQLLSVALGGSVQRNPQGQLGGRLPLALTTAGAADPLLRLLEGQHVIHLNGDIVTEFPSGATVLACSPDGSPQAVQVGPRAWGLQFHPEAGPAIFDGWTITPENLSAHSDSDPAAGVREHADELRAVNDVIAHRFLQIVADAAR